MNPIKGTPTDLKRFSFEVLERLSGLPTYFAFEDGGHGGHGKTLLKQLLKV